MEQKNMRSKKFLTFSRLRFIFALILLLSLVIGSVTHTGIGTACTYCPIGILQLTASSFSITLSMLIIFITTVLVVVVAGRIFCAWGCPTSFLHKIFGTKHRVSLNSDELKTDNKLKQYSAYLILILSIIGSYFVGFPLFCLICPIGLFFGIIFAVARLFNIYQPGWELIVFPIILFLELFLLKSWCGSFCPIGAFFRIINSITGRIIKLKASKSTCTRLNNSSGHGGHVCKHICSEGLSIPEFKNRDIKDCNLCLKCVDNCPSSAIKIKFFK